MLQKRPCQLAFCVASFCLCLNLEYGVSQDTPGGTPSGAETPSPTERIPWFKDPDVLNEIKVNPKQSEQLERELTNYWDRYRQETTSLDAALDEQARAKRQAALFESYQESVSRSLDEVIKDRISRRRYDELYRQYQGYHLFHNPRIRQQLELTSEQLDTLRGYDLEWNEELKGIQEEFARNRPMAMRELRHARRHMKERILDTLSPEQQLAWRELTGEEFHFPAGVFVPAPPPAAIKPTADPE